MNLLKQDEKLGRFTSSLCICYTRGVQPFCYCR